MILEIWYLIQLIIHCVMHKIALETIFSHHELGGHTPYSTFSDLEVMYLICEMAFKYLLLYIDAYTFFLSNIIHTLRLGIYCTPLMFKLTTFVLRTLIALIYDLTRTSCSS